MIDPVPIAQSLIRCRSVTPDEGGALSHLERELGAHGFECHRLHFSEAGTPGVDNLYARLGHSAPHVCFAGHTDVVPPGEEAAWRHAPFEGNVENGILYGRGACDMKGGLAATVAATLQYLHETGGRPKGSISFLVTGDEEGLALNGTKKVVDWLRGRGERPDCCVLAECTSEQAIGDTIKIGRRGSITARLTLRGTQGHVAYPRRANNPLPRLVDLLTLLKSKPLDEGNAHFPPSNLEITSIDTGNMADNVIPAVARAQFNIRFNDEHTGQSLKRWIESQVAAALLDTGISHGIEYRPICDSFLTAPGAWVAKLGTAVFAETGREPALSTSGGTSDARFIKDLCPVVELGLLNATAHKVDECTSVADLESLTRIFTRFLRLAFC